jgi:hypothetical protein
MQERVRHLGWQETEIIDEDLGRSAAGTTSALPHYALITRLPASTLTDAGQKAG